MKTTQIFVSLFVLILAIHNNNGGELSPTNEIFSSAILTEDKKISLEVSREFVEEVWRNLESSSGDELVANLNNYTDKIFKNLDTLIANFSLDPYALADQHQSFNYLLIWGSLDLTQGYFQGLSTMCRSGDVELSYDPDTNTASLVLPITFNDLLIHYHYKTTLYFAGPSGNVSGTISDFQIEVKISFDFNAYQATLDHFYITDSGHIGVVFSGNVLTDWLANLLTNLTTSLFKEIILLIMEAVIRDPIKSIISSINAILNYFLSTAAATTTTVATTLAL